MKANKDKFYDAPDELIPPGVVEKVLEEALAKNRRIGKLVEPYVCTVPTCNRLTDNSPYNGVCRSCQEMGNTTSEPFVQVSRVMGWLANTPSDLIEVLTGPIQLEAKTLKDGTVIPGDTEPRMRPVEELVAISHTPEGQDLLALLWDKGTRFPAYTTVVRQTKTEDRRTSGGIEYKTDFQTVPKEQWIFESRHRPATRSEREAQAKASEVFYVKDKERIEVAKKAALLKQLQEAQEAVLKAGFTDSE